MKNTSNRLIKKVISLGAATLMSRLLGLIRELLLNNFLGGAHQADLFFTAYKIPNSLRKVFAEGALSAALVPSCIKQYHEDGQQQVSRLISLVLVLFQSLLIGICLFIFWKAEYVIRFIAPGWFIHNDSHHNIIIRWLIPAWSYDINPSTMPVITYTRILIGFIVCISSSAIIAAALQVRNHFFIPSISPIILNIVFILGLLAGIHYSLPVEFLCYVILGAGILQSLGHMIAYWYYDFSFCLPNGGAWRAFFHILKKFIPCFVSMSIMEINFFVSTSQATYLPAGTIAAIYYANRFMGIPLGVFSVALSTILLPYFSRVSLYAPQRLGFYLFESAKLIFWCCIPLSFLLLFYSEKIFITLFLSSKFSLQHAHTASLFLRIFGSGLFFFSFNKILLNVYYSLHKTGLIGVVCLLTALSNYFFGKIFVYYFAEVGLLYAFVLASSLQTVMLGAGLYYRYKIAMYPYAFLKTSIWSALQHICLITSFIGIYFLCLKSINILPSSFRYTLLEGYCFWLWNIPLIGLLLIGLFTTKKYNKTKLLFL